MAPLRPIPPVTINPSELAPFGQRWLQNENLSRTPPYSSSDLGRLFDKAVGNSLAEMLGGIPIITPNGSSLLPAQPDCVEVGPVRIIGGVRPQNFDVGYRPDGVRIAFDSKTLNDRASVGKNWQNMVNDLATEATTVHTRFPHAIVAFMVIVPAPCIENTRTFHALSETLERMTGRTSVEQLFHKAEAIAFVI